MKIKLSKWQIAVITIAVIGVVFWLDVFLSMFRIIPGSGGKEPDEKYVYVDFEDENLIFYMFDEFDLKYVPRIYDYLRIGNGTKPGYGSGWEVGRIDYYQKKVEDGDCLNLKNELSASRVVYGETPKCFEQELAPHEIIKGDMYYISRGVVAKKISTGGAEGVQFMLVDCEVMNDEKCLEQYAPDWAEKGYGVYDCEATPERTCLITNSPAPPDIEERHARMLKLYEGK